ncbi:hypothetical protein AGOR_G00086280 [Albula goreensis]|uniref:E3 ubiquitin-protein ligase CHFR n=1 Tax=Albula goreensis TaxID=1534307 RepID=A0A8T3DJQ9_9TELE|nr:hypothetical protein AGOR_G00086280 [Albula goreensis]
MEEEEGKVSESPIVKEDGLAKEEIWCLKRVGRSSDWLHLFDNTEVTLGRALNVTYQLLSPTCPLMISRQHCKFKQNEDGQWTVTDKKSLNGVWVNGTRIVPERAWPLTAGDSVRLGVPVEGAQVEFDYVLVRDSLQAVAPFLLGVQTSFDPPAPPRVKNTKRRLEVQDSDLTGSPESQAKLYRSANVDKSLGLPCPIGDSPLPPPQQPQSGEVAGPSVAPTQLDGPQPILHSSLSPAHVPQRSDSLHMFGNRVRHSQQQDCASLEEMREPQALQQQNISLQQEKMRLEVERRQQQEENLKKQLECALQEQRKVIEELKCSRQGFEEILQAKDKELEMTKEEKEQAQAQKDEVVIQMTDVLENELQCIICSELFIEAVTLSCAHSFCQHCIDSWRKRSVACPICRQDILSQTRSLVLDNCIDRMVESLSTELKERRQALIAERKGERPVDSSSNNSTSSVAIQ